MLGTAIKPHTKHAVASNISTTVFFTGDVHHQSTVQVCSPLAEPIRGLAFLSGMCDFRPRFVF